jgi:hypothetical protein
MKKLLLTFLLPLIALSSVSHGEELNSLFGISLYDNAEKYVSSSYIDSNKIKNSETLSGYFDISITDKIKNKSPYASEYWISIDINNVVHSIRGEQEFANLRICQDVLETLSSSLEERYEIDFEYWEPTMPTFKVYSYYHYSSLDDYFAIQCNEDYENPSIVSQIYLDSKVLVEANNKFYESGL